MARNSAEAGSMLDQSTPQWMRELIRRRAHGRTLQVGSSTVKLTCPAAVAVVRQPEIFGQCENVASRYQVDDELVSTSSSFSNQTQVEEPIPNLSSGSIGESACNMRLLDTNCVVLNGGDVRNKQSAMCVTGSQNIIMVEDKKANFKKKSATSRARASLTQNTSPSVNNKTTVGSDKMNGILSRDDDSLSDSSEELQYGPGIVNRLKTKYLSMTLREQKKKSRPSLINLRRATSLENMLEVDGNINNLEKKSSDTTIKTENKPSKGNNKTTFVSKPVGPNSNRVMKYLGNRSSETMKRARSMDTLLKTDLGQNTFKENLVPSNGNKYISKNETTKTILPIVSIVNENIIIVESVPVCSENTDQDCPCDIVQNSSSGDQIVRSSSCDSQDRELPPPDLVKQTLKIFEPSAKRKTKTSNGSLSKLVAGFSTVSSQSSRSVNNRSIEKVKMNPNKPSISPKPVISPEKLRQHRSRVSSPKKNPINPNPLTDSKLKSCEDNPAPTRINNLNSLTSQTLIKTSEVNKNRALPTPIEDDSPSITSTNSLSNNSSNSSLSNVFTTNSEQSLPNLLQRRNLGNISALEEKDDNLNEYDEPDRPSIDSPKPVLESALENIRRGGLSVQFSFNNENSQTTSVPKTYLPISKTPPQALNSSLLKQKLESSPPSIAPLRISSSPTGTKQIGIIRPLVSTKNQSSPPVVLTDQEIEKNLINRVKSIEPPISKVVVAVKALPDNVVLGSVSDSVINKNNSSLPRVSTTSKPKSQGLWDEEKIWQNNQNTIVFNFSDRKDVPDYIENDGLILRGKREKPRPGEGGIILLEGADIVEESCTDNEDFITSEPPSPCDVTFLNDNVLINGKSNLQKSPKQVKLRIKFNDDATTMFEYPSEASMVEDEPAASAKSADEVDRDSEGASSQPPSTSSAALPSSMPLGVPPPDYLPPPVPVKTVKAKSPVELTVKARAPQPPAFRPPVPARSPLRRSPSDPGTLPRQLKPQNIKQTPEPSLLQDTSITPFIPKKQKYCSKKKLRPCESKESVTLHYPILEPSVGKKIPESVDLQEMPKIVPANAANSFSHCSEDTKSISLFTSQNISKSETNSIFSKRFSEAFEKENPLKSSVGSILEEKTSVSSSSKHVLKNSVVPKTQPLDVPTRVHEVLPFQSQPSNLKGVCSLSSNQILPLSGSSLQQISVQPLDRDLQGKEPTQSNVKIESPLANRKIVQTSKPSFKVAAVIESRPSSSYKINFNSSMTENPLLNQSPPTKSDMENLQTSSLPHLQSSSNVGHFNTKTTPMYSPVYSKHQSRFSSELKVNTLLSPSLCKKPLLSPSLCKKPYLGTDIIKAQNSAKKTVLVLEGWPPGTESLV